jgi:hypothetical protein
MVTQLKEEYIDIEVPSLVTIPVPGCEPVVFCRRDMTNDLAWYKLAVKHDMWLEEWDFEDKNNYIKYYLLSLGLLEYPMVIISGEEGGGKSLVMAWLTYAMVNLFHKRCTLDWSPAKPELFGKYFSLYDEDFTERIMRETNRLANLGREPTIEELESLIIYNTVFGLDECDSYADKASRTNLTKLLGRIITRRRHFHTGIFTVFVDPNTADKRYFYNRKTHFIQCGYQWKALDTCSYSITHFRGKGMTKQLHLKPADHADLWNTHSTVALSHDVEISFGKKKHPKKIKEDD